MKAIAILSADIIDSRQLSNKELWLDPLKSFLNEGSILPLKPGDWSIYRGDSFQLSVAPEEALFSALVIRSRLRSISPFHEAGMDVRIAIGIGSQSYRGADVAESDGTAYQLSGQLLDRMAEKGLKLAIETENPEMNEEFGVHFYLLNALIEDWSQASASTVFSYLSAPGTQQELAASWGISQPAVQRRMQRAQLQAIQLVEERFRKQVHRYFSNGIG